MSFTTDPTNPSQYAPTDASSRVFPLLSAVAAMGACVASGIWAAVAVLDAVGPDWASHKPYAIYAGLVCGGAAIIAFIPVWWLSRKSVQGAAMGFMAGMLVRMGLCGLAVILGGRMEGVEQQPWSFWVAGWYMLVLAIEVGMIARYVKQAEPKSAAQQDGTKNPSDMKVEYRATS